MSEAPDHPMIVKLMRDGYVEVPEPLYDIFDTEIGIGEAYFITELGEIVHPDNYVEYSLEMNFIQIKTR